MTSRECWYLASIQLCMDVIWYVDGIVVSNIIWNSQF